MKLLLYYRSARARYESEQRKKAWRQELFKMWNEALDVIERTIAVSTQIWEHNTELLKKLQLWAMAEYLHSSHGRNVKDLSQRILALQRTPSSDDLAPQIEALGQSIKLLLEIGREQPAFAELLICLRVYRQKLADSLLKEGPGQVGRPSEISFRVVRHARFITPTKHV